MKKILFALAIVAFVSGRVGAVMGQLIVAGSPGFVSTSGTGYVGGSVPVEPGMAVNNSGTAVGYSQKFVSYSDKGFRAVQWDATGPAATELGNLGTNSSGFATSIAYAVNDAGTAVGLSHKYAAGNVDLGARAVRWNVNSTAATELGNLGTASSTGIGYAQAWAVNDAGTAVGNSKKYASNSDRGTRAVRWDPSGTAATELGNLGTSSNGTTAGSAFAINDAGTAVGYSDKYIASVSRGSRAVRWAGSGTVATELGNLGTASGSTFSQAFAVNEDGTAVGYAYKYSGDGSSLGMRAVRWDGSGTAATELGNLGTTTSGFTFSWASAVNEAGTAVGYSEKYNSGSYAGERAVRWDSSSTAAIELGNLGTTVSGVTESRAFAINNAGTAVGYAEKYDSGTNVGDRAVIWLPNGSVIDLNDLDLMNPPDGSWTLTNAKAMSADGWVAGEGIFTPTTGMAYQRHWVAQVGGFGGAWTADFSGTLDGTWGRGSQWSTGTPALEIGDATFNADAAYTVSLDREETTHSIAVEAGDVTLDMNGHVLTSLTDVTVSGARLKVADGTLAGAVTVETGGTLAGTGAVSGLVTVSSGGTLAPGSSPGTININGNYNQLAGGTLEIEIDGAGGGQFDVLNVTSLATLAGNLDVVLADGFSPGLGDSFPFLTASNFSGEFATSASELPALGEGLGWLIEYNPTYVSLNVVPAVLYGDYNVDGTVDAADYVVWQKTLDTTGLAAYEGADGSGNGMIGPEDYNVWKSYFGQSTLPVGGEGNAERQSVPEPTAQILLLMGIAMLGLLGRQLRENQRVQRFKM